MEHEQQKTGPQERQQVRILLINSFISFKNIKMISVDVNAAKGRVCNFDHLHYTLYFSFFFNRAEKSVIFTLQDLILSIVLKDNV